MKFLDRTAGSAPVPTSTAGSTSALDATVKHALLPHESAQVLGIFDELQRLQREQDAQQQAMLAGIDHARRSHSRHIEHAVLAALDYPKVASQRADAHLSKWTTIVHDHLCEQPFARLPPNYARLYGLRRAPTWRTIHAVLVRRGYIPSE